MLVMFATVMLRCPDKKDAVLADAEVLKKVIEQSLIVMGYRVHDSLLEIDQTVEGRWIIGFIYEVER